MDIPTPASPLEELLQRVRDEYADRPNLRLTPSQAQQVFGLEPAACVAILEVLMTENFLTRTNEGYFVRTATPH